MKALHRFAVSLLLALAATVAAAQNANTILDKSSAMLKSAGNVKIGFTLTADGSTANGYIKLQGQKFVVNTGNTITWFDGKTMWNYVKANEEVNVTTPTAEQVAKMNPYAFLAFYKNGYTAKMGSSTAKEHEVVLTGDKGGSYSKVVLRINKSNNQPTYIHMTSTKGNTTEIRCNSFQQNQKYNANTFTFNQKSFPKAEVVDLR